MNLEIGPLVPDRAKASRADYIALASIVLVLGLCPAGRADAQWDLETPLTSTGSDVWGTGIAASGSTVHLIFGTSDLNYRRSMDEGKTWNAATRVGGGVLHLTDPIVADGNDVWVLYLDNMQNMNDWCCQRDLGSIWLLRSRNGGTSWDSPRRLTTPNTAFRLSIAYAANRLHVVWMDFRSGAWDTYYLRSPDRGDTWDPEAVLASSTGPFGAERPQVAARGDSVHVTIWDDRDDNPACMPGTFQFPKCPDVYHVRSTDGGENWGTTVNVANGGAGFAGRNDIAVAGNAGVVINYNVDLPGETGSKLFAVASKDDGATWEQPIRLTTSANASDHGSIIGDGDDVYLVWHDDRDPGNREIYYRHTPNAGASWNAEEQVSSGATGDSSTPLNAVTPGFAHVIWIDNRGGSYQVNYRRRALEPAPMADAGANASKDAGGTEPPSSSDGGSPRSDGGATADAGAASGDAGAAAAGKSGAPAGMSGSGGNPSTADGTGQTVSGRDAATTGPDGGGTEPRASSDGCGCRLARAAAPLPHPSLPAGIALCGLLLSRTRRLRRASRDRG